MDDARLQQRITVILVSTRAAVASLKSSDEDVAAAIGRGIALLDGITDDVRRNGGPEAAASLRQARAELGSLGEGGRSGDAPAGP